MDLLFIIWLVISLLSFVLGSIIVVKVEKMDFTIGTLILSLIVCTIPIINIIMLFSALHILYCEYVDWDWLNFVLVKANKDHD